MKIIVMCENLMQFNNYVYAVLHDESNLTKRTITKKGCNRVIVHIDDLEFIYCSCPYILRGCSFGKDDRIVKVGSWYNIPKKIQNDIVAYFAARVRAGIIWEEA